ncbi:MAG TPA: PqqD family protein [Paracoccaceae bacterium]|nr:PqqD family protein [Paracoccaceae bacterium]
MDISIPEHVLFRELDGEAELLDLKSQQYFGLNEIGTRVWTALQQGEELSALVEEIVGSYDAQAEQVRVDIDQLINELQSANLIVVNDNAPE